MTPTARPLAGFSLIELLVSIGIGMVVLLVATVALDQTATGYERVEGSTGAEREARAAFSRLAADLMNARADGEWQTSARQSEGWESSQLGFLSLQPGDAQAREDQIGDLCALRYYLKDMKIGGRTVRCLMRGMSASGPTFRNLRDGATEKLFVPEERDEPLAFNVVSFRARPVVRTNEGRWREWDDTFTIAPMAWEIHLVIAHRKLAAKRQAKDSEQWHRQQFGDPSNAAEHRYLEVFNTTINFGADVYRR
jgi:hypothetical protein